MSVRGTRRPRRHGRTLALAGAALGALMIVVALASRGVIGAEEADARAVHPALPSGAFAYVYAAMLVVAVVTLPLFFYVYARETLPKQRAFRRAWLAPLWLAGIVLGLLAVSALWNDEFRAVVAKLHVWGAGGRAGSSGATPPAPEWAPLIVVSSVLTVGAGSLVAWRRLHRRARLGALPTLAETLSQALALTLDDLRGERDPRRAIILAYAHMEAALERSGVPRRESEAPLEYLSRVLLELDVSPGPVRTLTDLFERAKFSAHHVDRTMQQRAVDALEQIRDDLEPV